MDKFATNTHERTRSEYWWIMFLMGTVSVGSSFVYDVPQALQTQLQSAPMNLDYFKFNMIYSVYSIPNMVLPLIGGCLTKLLGVRLGIIIFAFLVLQGQMIFSLGVYWQDYLYMIIGRVIYALGAESLYIAQLAMAVQYFSKKELTFVLGWNNSLTYLANVINGLVTPVIYEYTQTLWAPCIFGTFLCVISLICGLAIREADKKHHQRAVIETEHPFVNFRKQFCNNLKSVSILFWGLLIYYIVTFPAFKAFTSNMNDLVHKRFGFSNVAAGQLGLLYYMQLIVISPLVGSITDKYGKRMQWLFGSGIIALAGHFLFAALKTEANNGYIVVLPLILLGTADSVFETTSWSCLCISLGEEMTEMGFGLATSGMNAITVLALMLVGKISDNTKEINFGYFYSEMFLETIAVLSLITLAIVAIIDYTSGSQLSKVYELEEEEAGKNKEYLDFSDEEEQECLTQDTS